MSLREYEVRDRVCRHACGPMARLSALWVHEQMSVEKVLTTEGPV